MVLQDLLSGTKTIRAAVDELHVLGESIPGSMIAAP